MKRIEKLLKIVEKVENFNGVHHSVVKDGTNIL
jgi:hypothetical protein